MSTLQGAPTHFHKDNEVKALTNGWQHFTRNIPRFGQSCPELIKDCSRLKCVTKDNSRTKHGTKPASTHKHPKGKQHPNPAKHNEESTQARDEAS
jgi:hypothetical protein